MARNYQTLRILKMVGCNDNQEINISTDPKDNVIHYAEPEIMEKLDKLFDDGADIILETNQGYDDDGGDCYQAYVIKAEHKEEFNRFWNQRMEDNQDHWQLAIFCYILTNPEHIITVWAGPY